MPTSDHHAIAVLGDGSTQGVSCHKIEISVIRPSRNHRSLEISDHGLLRRFDDHQRQVQSLSSPSGDC